MPVTIERPVCLHVPPLYAGNTAQIYWKGVEGAGSYELEGCFDSAMDMGAVGRSWQHLEFESLDWAGVEAAVPDWSALDSLPAQFTLFRGAGADLVVPDVPYTWSQLDKRRETWAENDALKLTWDEWKVLPAHGLSWDAFDAKCLTWSEAEQLDVCWEAFEALEADTGLHKSCAIPVPETAQRAYFRVKACGAPGEYSETLATGLRYATTRSTAALHVNAGDDVHLQLDGNLVRDSKNTTLCLTYDPAVLALDTGLLYGGQAGYYPDSKPRIVHIEPGVLKLAFNRAAAAGATWDGMLARVCFTAKKAGTTQLGLERKNTGGTYVV